jgi:hypothetical protein
MDDEAEFTALADAAVEAILERHPDEATFLGDHRFDDRLPDLRPEALADDRRVLGGFAERLAKLDLAALPAEHRVDALILANRLATMLYDLDELRPHEWDPLMANPGRAVYGLLAREFAPAEDRLVALAGRLAAIPETLEVARRTLGAMPRVHVETALGQFAGTEELIGGEVDRLLEAAPGMGPRVDAVRPAAIDAIAGHRRWLEERLSDDRFRDPRIGAERFGRKLALTLDAEADADAILVRAETDLVRVGERIAAAAARRGAPSVQAALDALAGDPPDDATILGLAATALDAATAFVGANDLVTRYDDPFEIIDMPEIDRGVAVAYCDPPGPLEAAGQPTFIAVAPTPSDWSQERVTSFYREYNRHLVHDLVIHEAMPGHMLQLQHSRRFAAPTKVRSAFWSGSFVEGWAVYAEEVMADHGYPGEGDPGAVRMQQLKMQLRMIINAILDARIHAHGMTENEAMRLMTERGFQEEGEAAGKWRRALLTSTQLSTYYVGYTEVRDLAGDVRAAHPGAGLRHLHDRMLAHGSPPARHLRGLVG